MTKERTVLHVDELDISFGMEEHKISVVKNVSLEVKSRQIVGIIGESGSGKSMTANAIMRLLPRGARVRGTIEFNGEVISSNNESRMARLRGNQISLIPQDSLRSLNPTKRIGWQVSEPIQIHGNSKDKSTIKSTVERLLELVSIPRPKSNSKAWPHQFSGGMQQRAMIATALSRNPSLIIADEPTTALDVTVQKEILALIKSARDNNDCAIIFITHDLGVVAELCDYVYVMRHGSVVEDGETNRILTQPEHEYTKMLLAATPSIYD